MSDEDWILEPHEFANARFAENNQDTFDEYISLKIRGASSHVAFRIAFGDEFVGDNLTTARIYSVERNPYFKANFDPRLQATKVGDLWNPKVAIHNLLCIAKDHLAKDSARLRAIQELNVLTNIVIVDENGKTKAGRSLADFYAEEGELVEVKPDTQIAESDLPADPAATRH